MLWYLLIAAALVVVTVATHAVGFGMLLRVMFRLHTLTATGFRRHTLWLIGLACWLISLHLAEICAWALLYVSQNCLPNVESALYFSGVTYTTVGYGDIVLPKPWRVFAPLEALTGVLMCGLSTGLFFAVVSRWISSWMRGKTAQEPDGGHRSNIGRRKS